MKFVYYIIKNQEIVNKIMDNIDIIKDIYKKLCEDSNELDEIEIYKIPCDVFVNDFSDLFRYGMNVTSDYLDDNELIVL